MSRDRRRWEEPASSHWEPRYDRSYSDEHSWRHWAPPTELFPTRSFNYWRDEPVAPTFHYPSHSYIDRRERSNEQWHDDSRPWHADSSYSRPWRHSGPGHDWDDREPRRDRNLPYRDRQRYSTHAPPPYNSRPTFRARSPTTEPIPRFPKPVPPLPPPPRKASPPLNKSSLLVEPTPAYLSLSLESSEVLHEPIIARKLLILDLNGTLLIRSARAQARVSSGPHLRPVQPRPYMQSFRQYLFCLETKIWLDTMVWSSAQPHSVDDMVDKVFGVTKNELKAVWNRKSLGLSEAEYHQKTVTTKDLRKPWDLLASGLIPEKLEGHSGIPSQPQITHSAFTTLLLDDSPHKAALQPYNHVCIPEYNSTKRQHDLRSFSGSKQPKEDKQNKKAKRKSQDESATHSTHQMVPELPSTGALSESATNERYDVTLLAVIGILEAVKLESNVAGWIRKGGLWAIKERRGEGGASDVQHHGIVKTEDGKTISSTVIQPGNDASSTNDSTVIPEQARPPTKMWFDDSSVVAYWVARGRRALIELGIQLVHGVTG